MSLQSAETKMSKSDPNTRATITLLDSAEQIRNKIKKAKSDSNPKITYEPKERPELANLLRIYSSIKNVPLDKIDQVFENDNMKSLKEKIGNALVDRICPIGDKTRELLDKREDYLYDVIDKGAKKANDVAEGTLEQAKRQVGIIRRKDSTPPIGENDLRGPHVED